MEELIKVFSRIFPVISIIYALGVIIFTSGYVQNSVKAATDNSNVVISQIQIAGTTANDEFVELYNPTAADINLAGWRLDRRTASLSATPAILVESLSGTIASRGYYLITSNESSASNSADKLYSNTNHIAANNTVILFSDAGQTVVDKVGLGTAEDNETARFTPNLGSGQSIIRKAFTTSNTETLSVGGADSLFGNGFDTDNNANDFVLIQASIPKNSASLIAQFTPTPTQKTTSIPTPTTTETPTEIPTPTQTPIPTMTPTLTPPVKIIVNDPISSKASLVCTETTHVITILGIHLNTTDQMWDCTQLRH